MTIQLLDPTGVIATTQRTAENILETLSGRKAGFIFNQHASGLAFWKGLEEEVERRFKPASMHRVYKENTWAPAPKGEVDKLIGETDYVLVGLGA
jgi:hypothetical protein